MVAYMPGQLFKQQLIRTYSHVHQLTSLNLESSAMSQTVLSFVDNLQLWESEQISPSQTRAMKHFYTS